MKIQNITFEKSQNYTAAMSQPSKGQGAKIYLKWINLIEIFTNETLHFSNIALLTKVPYILAMASTIIKTVLRTYSRQKFFLHFTCSSI